MVSNRVRVVLDQVANEAFRARAAGHEAQGKAERAVADEVMTGPR